MDLRFRQQTIKAKAPLKRAPAKASMAAMFIVLFS
jgi:hypothetical protein